MSNLSELLPTGGGQNVVELTADGAITAGQAVALQSDGTIAPITETSVAQAIGTPVAFSSGGASDFSVMFDEASEKTVIVYRDQANSNRATAVVATVSGTSISYGTPVAFSAASANAVNAIYVPSIEGVVVVLTQGSVMRCFTGVVSGTSISFAEQAQFGTGFSSYTAITYNSRDNLIVVAWADGSNSNYGTARAARVSRGSVIWGTAIVFNSATTRYISCAYNYNFDYFAVVYQPNTSSPLTSKVVSFTRSLYSTSADFNTFYGPQGLNVSSPSLSSMAAVPNTDQFIAISQNEFRRGSFSPDYGISWDPLTEYTIPTLITKATVLWLPNSSQYLIVGEDPPDAQAVLATPLGANTLIGSPITLDTPIDQGAAAGYDPIQKKIVVAYEHTDPSTAGKAVVFQNAYSYSNNADFIGFAVDAIADGASGNVNVYGGISENQTGLTPASDYYIKSDASLAEESSILDIASSTYAGNCFNVGVQDFSPQGIAFNTDGTKMFIVGIGNDSVYQYSLTTGFDLNTASYDSVSFSVASQDADPRELEFNTDGTKMFVIGSASDAVYQYSLTTGFDLSTASYDSVSFSVATEDSNPYGFTFNNDGTKMFVSGLGSDSVFQYSLTTGFDLSTASYDSVSFNVSSVFANLGQVKFNLDGTKMFLLDSNTKGIVELNLSTAFDISTASFSSGISIWTDDSLAGVPNQPNSFTFNSDHTKFYVVGRSPNGVAEFTMNPSPTNVKAGKAISTTAINLVDV